MLDLELSGAKGRGTLGRRGRLGRGSENIRREGEVWWRLERFKRSINLKTQIGKHIFYLNIIVSKCYRKALQILQITFTYFYISRLTVISVVVEKTIYLLMTIFQ